MWKYLLATISFTICQLTSCIYIKIMPVASVMIPHILVVSVLKSSVPKNSVRDAKCPGSFTSPKNTTFLTMRMNILTFPQCEEILYGGTPITQPLTACGCAEVFWKRERFQHTHTLL
jgi:hypothetical protein